MTTTADDLLHAAAIAQFMAEAQAPRAASTVDRRVHEAELHAYMAEQQRDQTRAGAQAFKVRAEGIVRSCQRRMEVAEAAARDYKLRAEAAEAAVRQYEILTGTTGVLHVKPEPVAATACLPLCPAATTTPRILIKSEK